MRAPTQKQLNDRGLFEYKVEEGEVVSRRATKPLTEIKLYTKAEREAAVAAWQAEWGHKSGAYKLVQADTRTLPTRKARVQAFKRTGKVPAGWMTPDTIKFGGVMSDKEAARVVLPRGLTPSTTFAPSLRDEVTERLARRYLADRGERLLETREEGPWPNARYTRQWEVWTCGCQVEGTGKVTGGTRKNPDEEFDREAVKPCDRHKRAFQGREEE